MNNFEVEKTPELNEFQSKENGKNVNSSSCLSIVIPRSMIIFISLITVFSSIALLFHAVPSILESKGLMFEKKGNLMRFDHRILSFIDPSHHSKSENLRRNPISSSSKSEFLVSSGPEYNQIFNQPRRLLEKTSNDLDSSSHNQKFNTTSLSADFTPQDSDLSLNSNIPTSVPTEIKPKFSSNYTCHQFVSTMGNGSFNHSSQPGLDINCKTHFIKAEPLWDEFSHLDLATTNAFNHLNEASQSVKIIAEILEKKHEDEGLLIVMASKMQYESNWRSTLEDIYGNWEFNTHVSQIILTSWTISKSFFVGHHYTPALDFGFMVLNIPPASKDKQASMKLKHSLGVVKMFISNLSRIIDGTIAKILGGPNYNILSDNWLTEDLFTSWNYTDKIFSYLSNYYNKNQTMLLENYLTSASLDASRLVEKLPLVIVDSVILAKDNLDNIYKENPSNLRYTDPDETQVVIIPPVERKKIARYDYEEKFRRICVYQAHTEQRSILRSTPSRASMAEYARYHGYSYFLFDGSFYDSIPRSLFTDWSKQGYYMKLFSGLKLLFWNLDKIGEILGKVIENPKADLLSEKFYSDFLEQVMPEHFNVDWDKKHNGRIGSAGGTNSKGSSGKEGIQITPSNLKVDLCDYVVWFDLDVAITNKYFSIERILDSNTPGFQSKPPEMFKNIYKDTGDISIFTARDSEWKSRNSLVNSGFLIVSRSRYSLQSLFHAIALDPVGSQEIVRNGRFWPEQSTLTHAIVNIFNHSYSSPNQTYHYLDTAIETVDQIKDKLIGSTPIMFTAYSNETGRFVHSVTASQKVANGFLHISPDIYGEGPWYPGDLFIHAAGQKSPFRDNVLSGMLYSINSIGYTLQEIQYFKDNCYISLDFVYSGLDQLIERLANEFVELENVKSNDLSNQLQSINNIDLVFHFIKKIMAVKTRASVKDISLYSNQTNYEKIHFLRCKYSLPMSTKWSIAEAFALGGISILGTTAIILIFKFAKMYSSKGITLQ